MYSKFKFWCFFVIKDLIIFNQYSCYIYRSFTQNLFNRKKWFIILSKFNICPPPLSYSTREVLWYPTDFIFYYYEYNSYDFFYFHYQIFHLEVANILQINCNNNIDSNNDEIQEQNIYVNVLINRYIF